VRDDRYETVDGDVVVGRHKMNVLPAGQVVRLQTTHQKTKSEPDFHTESGRLEKQPLMWLIKRANQSQAKDAGKAPKRGHRKDLGPRPSAAPRNTPRLHTEAFSQGPAMSKKYNVVLELARVAAMFKIF
jgi:hypothetical protein